MKRKLSSLQSWREILVEHSLDAVVGINSQSHVIDWNFQAEKIFGWTKEQVLGKTISSLIIPLEFREAHHAGIKHYLECGVGPILNKRIELTAQNHLGQHFPIELTVSPIKVDDELLFYSFVRDISERKAMEQALKDAVNQRDEFIRVCSHELKTPVSSMKLQFQMAKHMMDKKSDRPYDKEAVEKRIVNANTQLDKMAKLIEDMLHATKMSTGLVELQKAPVDINDLTKETLASFEEQLEMLNIHVEVISPSRPVMVNGDRYRLEQVITNLVTNAMKYGGEKPFEIKIEVEGQEAHLTVADQGIGIPHENISKIFERYERVNNNTHVSGLGLGLYICDQIMKAHDGKILVESVPDKGSKFVLIFPLFIT
jgi:PAS domain S-box-containing protein